LKVITEGMTIHQLARWLRPILYSAPTPGGTTDHGSLLGLADDDHTQYLNVTRHTAIGDSSPHHTAVTLDVNADTVLSLNIQELGLDSQAQNSVFAGPAAGGAGTPTFRALVSADITGILPLHASTHENGGADEIDVVGLSGLLADGQTPLAHAASHEVGGADLVNHDSLTGFVANEHINHTSVMLTAGSGLTGGGTIAGSRTFNVGAGNGISVAANSVAVNQAYGFTWTASHTFQADIQLDADLDFVGAQSITTTSGNLTIQPSGDIIINPLGNDMSPSYNYDINLGSLSKKYLTLHAAELWVETLVAQNTIATIGGRILVGPTTMLAIDLTAVATQIYVEHNQMASGDRVYMEAAGKVEFMAITSGPVGVGPYLYQVTRNLDGSGANTWYAGDAIFNTGTTGDGFIDLYSYSGVTSGTVGPTIVGNVRNSSTYNDWTEHWAIGNLDGVYGYGVTTYGVGLGSNDYNHLTIDATNGMRFYSAATLLGQLTSSSWTLGITTSYHTKILATGIEMYDSTPTRRVLIQPGVVYIGDTSGLTNVVIVSGSSGITINGNSSTRFRVDGAGVLWVGDSSSTERMEWNSVDGLTIYDSANVATFQASPAGNIDIVGTVTAGGGNSLIDTNGFSVISGAAYARTRAYTILDGTTVLGSLYARVVGTPLFTNYVQLTAAALTAKNTWIEIESNAVSGHVATTSLQANDASNAATLKVISSDGGGNSYCEIDTDYVTTNNLIFVNDTTNSFMTRGLTLNQGANDNEILALKSSDVAHGMTALTETDTYGVMKKVSSGVGGIQTQGYTESIIALSFLAYYTTDSTAKSTNAIGAITHFVRKKSGTSYGNVGTGENLWVLKGRVSGADRAIAVFAQDGDLYLDTVVNENAWDEYDDGLLLHGLRASLVPDGHAIRKRFGQWIDYARPVLERAGIVHYNDDGHHFVATKQLQMLTIDAVRQLYERINTLESKLRMLGMEV